MGREYKYEGDVKSGFDNDKNWDGRFKMEYSMSEYKNGATLEIKYHLLFFERRGINQTKKVHDESTSKLLLDYHEATAMYNALNKSKSKTGIMRIIKHAKGNRISDELRYEEIEFDTKEEAYFATLITFAPVMAIHEVELKDKLTTEEMCQYMEYELASLKLYN